MSCRNLYITRSGRDRGRFGLKFDDTCPLSLGDRHTFLALSLQYSTKSCAAYMYTCNVYTKKSPIVSRITPSARKQGPTGPTISLQDQAFQQPERFLLHTIRLFCANNWRVAVPAHRPFAPLISFEKVRTAFVYAS